MKLYLMRQHWNWAKEITRVVKFTSEEIVKSPKLVTKDDIYSTRSMAVNNYITVASTEELIKYDTREMVELWIEADDNFYYGQGTIKALDTGRSLVVIETPRPLFDRNGENIKDCI